MYWWFVYSMFLNSGNNEANFLELAKLEYFSLITFYCLDACTTSFLSSAYSGLTIYLKLREEISSLRYSGSTRYGFAFAVGEPSFEVVFWPLFNMALCFLIVRKKITEMVIRIHREIHKIEQTKKVIPFISWETPFAHNVRELVFGNNIFDLDFGFHIDSMKQQVRQPCEFWTRFSSSDLVLYC